MRLLTALGMAGLVCAQVPAVQDYGYEVASIKKADPTARGSRLGPGPQGGMRTTNTSLMALIEFVYNVREYQVIEAPGWIKTEAFDVSFTPDKPDAMPAPGSKVGEVETYIARNRLRMKAVLRDRFGLVLREETRQLPVYGLVVAKGGHKLKTPDEAKTGPSMSTNPERGQMTGYGVNMGMFTRALAGYLQKPVVDETGFTVPF
ncbi:MAG: TIGR03435 family protein [Acidobacteriia bacterium]|nr:TIGR03435 family protein [Terriglobia bacterium]